MHPHSGLRSIPHSCCNKKGQKLCTKLIEPLDKEIRRTEADLNNLVTKILKKQKYSPYAKGYFGDFQCQDQNYGNLLSKHDAI